MTGVVVLLFFTAVQLVSGRDDVPSAAGAEDPAISEDGRIVVFTSIDRSLFDATFPVCVGECPTQIYRYDRDTDVNGVLAGCAAGMTVFGYVDLTPAEKLADAGATRTFTQMRDLPALLI
jgi:hypothetical protein